MKKITLLYKKGSALFMTVSVCSILALGIGMNALLFSNEVYMCRNEIDSVRAFYLAESGIDKAVAIINNARLGNNNIMAPVGSHPFSFSGATGGLSASTTNIEIDITAVVGQLNMYDVRVSATERNSTRTLRAGIFYNPPSQVFDYPYFINNWGWWYGNWNGGSRVIINGDVRTNGNFSVAGQPWIDGEIYSADRILDRERNPVDPTDIQGKAGTVQDGELIYQHPGCNKLTMPNLTDLDFYEEAAIRRCSSIAIDKGDEDGDGIPDNLFVVSVYGDDDGEETGDLCLDGTNGHPIVIYGPVVVRGNVIIKGVVTGQGTIYAGKNIYIAGDLEYRNGPDFDSLDYTDQEEIDQWVEDSLGCDILGLAARENIILGDYENWPSNVTTTYLFNMGSEDVGRDGILGTGDQGEGDGVFEPEYEDLDQDGEEDHYYDASDYQIPNIGTFHNLPKGFVQAGKTYSDLATNDIKKIEGILYTNHAVTGRIGDITHDGCWVCKDEATIYGDGKNDGHDIVNQFTLNYDYRIHSRNYQRHMNQSWLVDLTLPVVGAQIISWSEDTDGGDLCGTEEETHECGSGVE